MKVAFNASQLLSPLTGIGQYTLNLGSALGALNEVDLEFFYANAWSRDLKATPSRRMEFLKPLVKRWLPFPYELSRAVQQRYFTLGIKRFRPELYHEPSFLPFRFEGRTVITVHDLSWVRFPDTHPVARVRIINKLLPLAIERATHILVDSEFVRSEVIDHYGVRPSKVTTTPLASRDIFWPRTLEQRRATLERNGVRDGSYFLCVGTLEPRKNVESALRAHALLPEPLRRRFPLVLVGMHGWLTSRLEHEMKLPAVRGEVITPGYVADEDLADLYSGACALLYPSIYEGFGLPPLEAMACGAPVIMSNASSLPEVGGPAAVLHDPHNVDALSLAMRRLVEDPQFRRERSAASLQQAAQFSWDRCARETLTVYKNTLAA